MTPQVLGVLLSVGAGLCTALGGVCVFFISSTRRLPLAVCMAASAGVMTYVSFVDIFAACRESMVEGLALLWNKDVHEKNTRAFAYLFSTFCFFGGWLLVTLMDIVLDLFVRKLRLEARANIEDQESAEKLDCPRNATDDRSTAVGSCAHRCVPCEAVESDLVSSESSSECKHPESAPKTRRCCLTSWFFNDKPARSESKAWEVAHAEECFRRDTRRFLQLGIFTSVALGIHNFPEGVATFTGALASNKLGVTLAIAIGIHNIPEGFAVSVPLYFGTGKKWRSFFLSVLTGFAEPLGALLAWAILGNNANPLSLGIAFGLVCGIMTNIALKELLPSAFKYDPCNQVTTRSFVGGMFIVAFSLVLLEFA